MPIGLGIDIGAESIKAVQVQVSGGTISVTGALKIPRRDLPAAEAGSAAALVPAGLGQELTKARMRRAGCLGLTGREVVLKYLTTPPMAPQKLRMFIDMQMSDRAIPGKRDDSGQGLTYDFRILNVPTGVKADMVIMAAAARNEYLYNVIAACKAAGVTARRLTTSAFGLAQCYLKTQEPVAKETMALVDVGHEGLEVALICEDLIYFARNGPGGSRRFDAALTKAFGWTGDRLREQKHNRVGLVADEEMLRSPQEKQVQEALSDGADAVAHAIRGSVTFLRTQAKLPRVDYRKTFICGGGARLKGLPEYLEAKTQRPVQPFDFSKAVDLGRLDGQSARCFDGEVTDMSVALGLALIDADPECFYLELTPQTVKARRVFWGRTVYAAAAGVVFLGSLAIPYVNAQKSLEVAEAKRDELAGMVTEAEQLKKAFVARIEENKKLGLKREYYARQARLGPVFLELWDRMRAQAPKGIMFTQVEPKGQNAVSSTLKEPLRELVVQGYYDPTDVRQFERTLQQFFENLRNIPGLDGVPKLNTAFDEGQMKKPLGTKGFEFEIQLTSPLKPILAGAKSAPGAPGPQANPAPDAGTPEEKTPKAKQE